MILHNYPPDYAWSLNRSERLACIKLVQQYEKAKMEAEVAKVGALFG